MKRNLKQLMPVICAGMFIFSGCTKQQTVKTDPSLAPSATTAMQTAAAQPGTPATASPEPAGSASVAGASSSGQAEPGSSNEGQKVLENIYFDFDSATLSDSARAALATNFKKLEDNPQARLRIEGHCDERGSDEYNLALSERRARAAFNYLSALGITVERLSAIGYGEEKPAASGQSEEALARNRRDEFAITK